MAATTRTGMDFFMEGSRSPINIQYMAIPMLFCKVSGNAVPRKRPAHVPVFQEQKAIVFIPNRKYGLNFFSSHIEANENVSSVIPKANKDINLFEVLSSIRWDSEADIRKCLKFKMNVAITISTVAAPRDNMLTPTNWLAPAKTTIESIILIVLGISEAFDSMPKAIAIGIYPKPIGIAAFNPFLNYNPLFNLYPSHFYFLYYICN